MKLTELREQISKIDKDMLDLFLKRMEVSRLIGLYKKEHHLPVFDERREKELIEKQKALLDNNDMWPFYKSFLKEVMDISKEYQKK
jgi:monofunctional chorismate mutase